MVKLADFGLARIQTVTQPTLTPAAGTVCASQHRRLYVSHCCRAPVHRQGRWAGLYVVRILTAPPSFFGPGPLQTIVALIARVSCARQVAALPAALQGSADAGFTHICLRNSRVPCPAPCFAVRPHTISPFVPCRRVLRGRRYPDAGHHEQGGENVAKGTANSASCASLPRSRLHPPANPYPRFPSQDIYSLGCLIYVMLAGKPPWPRLDLAALALRVAFRGERPPLHELSSIRCPPKLRKLV